MANIADGYMLIGAPNKEKYYALLKFVNDNEDIMTYGGDCDITEDFDNFEFEVSFCGRGSCYPVWDLLSENEELLEGCSVDGHGEEIGSGEFTKIVKETDGELDIDDMVDGEELFQFLLDYSDINYFFDEDEEDEFEERKEEYPDTWKAYKKCATYGTAEIKYNIEKKFWEGFLKGHPLYRNDEKSWSVYDPHELLDNKNDIFTMHVQINDREIEGTHVECLIVLG